MPPHRNKFTFPRSESRIPMEIPVMLEGHRHLPGVETTFTENVSAKGARVISVRHWEKNARLTFASRTGEFRSSARVAYCQPVHGDGYAIGLEFLESKGRWVVESAN
ncbi:MAG TPA: PilZ domain-containing protein [Dongiaceae bacterium]|nr:PilZ domain-containing protein [Dongiaceae bacterium]